jgi:hypothetical protein
VHPGKPTFPLGKKLNVVTARDYELLSIVITVSRLCGFVGLAFQGAQNSCLLFQLIT